MLPGGWNWSEESVAKAMRQVLVLYSTIALSTSDVALAGCRPYLALMCAGGLIGRAAMCREGNRIQSKTEHRSLSSAGSKQKIMMADLVILSDDGCCESRCS